MTMTRRAFFSSTLCLGLISAMPMALAAGRGTPEQAKALAKKAAQYVSQVGTKKAFSAFTNDPAWHDGDLFVYAYDFKGICVANGGVKALVGKDMSQATDPISGDKIVASQIARATGKGEGWHEDHFSNPATKKIEPKKTYIIRVGNYYLGVGAYVGS